MRLMPGSFDTLMSRLGVCLLASRSIHNTANTVSLQARQETMTIHRFWFELNIIGWWCQKVRNPVLYADSKVGKQS